MDNSEETDDQPELDRAVGGVDAAEGQAGKEAAATGRQDTNTICPVEVCHFDLSELPEAAILAHYHEHLNITFKCNVEGCTQKQAFATRDRLEHHQRSKHDVYSLKMS